MSPTEAQHCREDLELLCNLYGAAAALPHSVAPAVLPVWFEEDAQFWLQDQKDLMLDVFNEVALNPEPAWVLRLRELCA